MWRALSPGRWLARPKLVRRSHWWHVCLLLATLACACTTTHAVRTVGRGNFALEGTLGGPMLTNLGAPIMAPNLFLGGRYGVLDDLDVAAAYNLTGPIIPGVGLDLVLGLHWVPVQPGIRSQSATPEQGWSWATALELHSLTDFQTGFVAVPSIDVAAGYRYRWLNPFVGCSVALNFFRPRGQADVGMVSPYLGVELIIREKVNLSLRITFHDVKHNYWGSQVSWVFLRDDAEKQERFGPVGLSVGVAYDFLFSRSSSPPRREQNDNGDQS